MNLRSVPLQKLLAGAIAAGLLVVGLGTFGSEVEATHMPADKVAAAGSTLEVMEPGGEVVVLSETFKVSSPTDLIIQLTSECAIFTNIATLGDGTSSAFGQVRMRVEIDGTPVPVDMFDTGANGTGEQGDPGVGKVVFCNRLNQQTTRGFDDTGEDDNEIAQYQEARQANAFNWMAVNPTSYDENGDNILEVEVIADFVTDAVQDAGAEAAFAEAYVGNRTLIIEPTKLAVHEQVTQDDAGGQ